MINNSIEFSPSMDPDEGNDMGGEEPLSSKDEQAPRDLEELAYQVRNALGTVGLFRADDITAERLSKVDPRILKDLTPQTAECLYFETWTMNRKYFGISPLRFPTLMRQAKSYYREFGGDLEQLQQQQREQGVRFLQWVHTSPVQLLQLLSGSEGKKQNINRLSFFLFDTQELRGFSQFLHDNGSEDETWNVEEIVIRAQEVIKEKLDHYEKTKVAQEKMEDRSKKWTYLDHQAYEFHRHRLGSAHEIGEMILDEMRDTTYEQFIAGVDPFGDK